MAVIHIQHPVVSEKLAMLRNKHTKSADFRKCLSALSFIMAYESARNFPLKKITVESVLENDFFEVMAGFDMFLVPVLRAGLGMVDGFLEIFPEATVAHLGFYRSHETLLPVEYYCKLPPVNQDSICFILDPMLATGGSACASIERLLSHGIDAGRIKFFSVLAAPEGLQKVSGAFPEVDIYTLAIDRQLNESGYILPGLGDAGDRIFGT